MSDRPQHVLILGCGRSGTSIFGELFKHLPPYTYYSEPPFANLKTFNYEHPVAVKVPKESLGFPPDPGLSFPLARWSELMPAPRAIYWQVRHPLDTICSLQVGIARDWGHHPRPPDWQQWLQRPLNQRCAHHWNYINSIGYRQVKELVKITRFEDMVRDPVGFAMGICRDVGVNVARHREAIEEWASRVQNTNNEKFIEAETSRPYSTNDHKVKVDRWKENMTLEEVKVVIPLIKKTAAAFGYALQDKEK